MNEPLEVAQSPGGFQHCAHRLDPGSVPGHNIHLGPGRCAMLGAQLARFPQQVAASGVEHQVHALPGQGHGQGPADAHGRAGEQQGFAAKKMRLVCFCHSRHLHRCIVDQRQG